MNNNYRELRRETGGGRPPSPPPTLTHSKAFIPPQCEPPRIDFHVADTNFLSFFYFVFIKFNRLHSNITSDIRWCYFLNVRGDIYIHSESDMGYYHFFFRIQHENWGPISPIQSP